MSDENPKDGNQASSPELTEALEEITKLKEQTENLTKGIAKYRDESQESKQLLNETLEDNRNLHAKIEGLSSGDNDEDIDLSPDDEKRLQAYMKKQGFMTKEELEIQKREDKQKTQKQIQEESLNRFLEKNPNLKDDDDAWKKFASEFKRYVAPTSADGYDKLFSEVKDKVMPKTEEEDNTNTGAGTTEKKHLSFGGGSSPQKKDTKIEDLKNKYPSLSKDQITERLSEIDEIQKEED